MDVVIERAKSTGVLCRALVWHCLLSLSGVLAIFVSAGGLVSAQEPLSAEPPSEEPLSEEAEQFFENRVRPLLMQRCSECHGAQKQESDLRVDSLASLKAGGASGERAVVPGKPGESLLLAAVDGTGDYEMPPEEPLSEEEVGWLRHWIEMGAPWPAGDAAAPILTLEELAQQQREEHWAFQPLATPIVPVAEDDSWSQTPVDRLIWDAQRVAGVTASPMADRHTLLRRLKLDLLGLPVRFKESQRFSNDARPDALSRQLDRYLASPAYGERWGRHWLDVARYADTRGYAFNRDRRYPYAYTYRNYVIDAFNSDRPYDRFILEQLAADQLELAEEEKSRLAGLGFMTVGRKFNNPHDDIDDKIDVVTRGFLGVTVACARCHDHKYDAIPTEDYYSLYGVFASSNEPGELPLIADQDAIDRNQDWFVELEARKAAIGKYQDEKHVEIEVHARTRVGDYLIAAVYNLPDDVKQPHPETELPVDQIKVQLRDRWKAWIAGIDGNGQGLAGLWHQVMALPEDEKFAEAFGGLRDEWLASDEANAESWLGKRLASAEISNRGDWLRWAGGCFVDAIAATQAEQTAVAGEQAATDAAELAQQQAVAGIVIGEKGLGKFNRGDTRSFLNRADNEHIQRLNSKVVEHQASAPAELGRAMVLEDLPNPVSPVVFVRGNPARRGDPVPRQFVGLLSRDERQVFEHGSGRLDLAREIASPDNPLTSRVMVNRVWMHHFRDPIVSTPSDFGVRTEEPKLRMVLDHLSRRFIESGWSVKKLHRELLTSAAYQQQSLDRPDAIMADPDNSLIYRQNPRRLGFEATRDSMLSVSDQLQQVWGGKPVDIFNQVDSPYRSVYAYIDRQDLPNLLRVFDFASPDQHAPQRPKTVVPQQALFLMNSEFIRHRSQELVDRLGLGPETPVDEGVQKLFRQVLARDPSSEEAVAMRELHGASEQDAWRLAAQVLLETNELVFID